MHKTSLILIFVLSLVLVATSYAAQLKPRIIVLTDIAPNDVEPDDMESMIRLLAHADLFEIEALVATTGWSNGGGQERPDLIHAAIDAYEKDLPNLRKRSDQEGHLEKESSQEIGYWPSPAYLRERVILGSTTRGMEFIGAENDSPGSQRIIDLAAEDDTRPLYIQVWGGGNTAAQAIWRVQQDKSEEELKTFLHKLRIYTITDQDKPYGGNVSFEISSHYWMRKEFADDLEFIWDECAWLFQNETGKRNWEEYENQIQGHGNLGALYPKFKYGVEGDTPSFLYSLPNGLNNPEEPTWVGWGGYFTSALTTDKETTVFTNHSQSPAYRTSRSYQQQFYPAIFNNFAARMDWAANGTGNRNPVISIKNTDDTGPRIALILEGKESGTVIADASDTTDPDGDELTFSWWILPEASTYKDEIVINGADTSVATLEIPEAAQGETIHLICEVTDNGTPNLTSYQRIIIKGVELPSLMFLGTPVD